MSIAIDLVLVGIVLLCAWRGFRTGIINGVCWILAVVIAIYGANLVANAYYSEFADMLETFAVGVVENTMNGDSENGSEDDDTVIDDELSMFERENLDVYEVSMGILKRLGVTESAAESMARETAETCDKANVQMAAELTRILCDRLSFVALFALSFALIAIVFTVIGNVFDLSFGIPGHENLNHVTGCALGVIRGLLIVMVLCCLGRYLGILIPQATVDKTFIYRRLVETNSLAELLNI